MHFLDTIADFLLYGIDSDNNIPVHYLKALEMDKGGWTPLEKSQSAMRHSLIFYQISACMQELYCAYSLTDMLLIITVESLNKRHIGDNMNSESAVLSFAQSKVALFYEVLNTWKLWGKVDFAPTVSLVLLYRFWLYYQCNKTRLYNCHFLQSWNLS